MDIFLMLLLIAGAITVLLVRNLFVATMVLGIVSFTMALIFISLDAVDVAFTESAVGAGISTVLYIGTLALVGAGEKGRLKFAPVPLLVSAAVGAILIFASFEMPPVGGADNPVQTHVAPRYVQETPTEIGVPNMVAAVLASYRGYDTFGEVTVIFTAGIAVIMILRQQRRRHNARDDADLFLRDGLGPSITGLGSVQDIVPNIIAKLLIPFILVFALYVQFHGDFGPGGGFQAGVIFAAAFILYALVFGLERSRQIVSETTILFLIALGVLIYGGTGVAGMLLGVNFLDYNVLASDPIAGQHLGILLVELGVGITVTAAMLAIFYAFVGRVDLLIDQQRAARGRVPQDPSPEPRTEGEKQ
ncbi:Na(+)/H(+) antiporter subunit B [Sneathiella sp.]|uniref:Na(+)/H(+) antiporter subunit B n=1 Tax=Sneathiella sp. TaxID=1964365 RepID=UPI003FA73220